VNTRASKVGAKRSKPAALVGPRMFIANSQFDEAKDTRGRSSSCLEKGPKQEGADFIKVYDYPSSRWIYGACRRSQKLPDYPVEGHVPSRSRAAEASDAGPKSIEHLTGMDEAKSDPKKKANALFAILHPKPDPGSVPRSSCATTMRGLNDARLADDPRLDYVKPSWKACEWKENDHRFGEDTDRRVGLKRKRDRPERKGPGRRPWKRPGWGILAGTDDANPLQLSRIQSARRTCDAGRFRIDSDGSASVGHNEPGRFFNKLDSMGTVSQSKQADLVLLDANPLDDIHNTNEDQRGCGHGANCCSGETTR